MSAARSSARIWASAVAMACLLGACGKGNAGDDSQLQDVFREDRNGVRRRAPSPDETLWTIYMGSCTGHLLAPDYMMTARHCNAAIGSRYISGSSLLRQKTPDIEVESVAENSPVGALDYSILKIRWLGQRPNDQKFAPLIATSPGDVVMSPLPGQGDTVFTVGFPGDRSSVTYAEGQLKEVRGSDVTYDMSAINGNSGGGVWVKKNNMLVSLTNAGPRVMGEAGWDSHSKDDPEAWNWGAGLWNAYARSAILKNIFPNGRNRFGGAAVNGVGVNGSGGSQIALALQRNRDSNILQAGIGVQASRVIACEVDNADSCSPSARGYRSGTYLRQVGNVAIYQLSSTFQANNGTYLSVVALDQAGQVVAKRTVRFAAVVTPR